MIGPFRALSHGRSGVWLGAVGEILVVALGVLLAFGLNAWWVEHTTRAEEQTHLRALARDFERNVGVLEALIAREDEIVAASLELLQLARKQPDADPAVVRPLMAHVFQSHRAELELDAYHALVNSAGLALIRDEELRGDLAGFASRSTDPYAERYADQLYMAFTMHFIGRLDLVGFLAPDSPESKSFSELLGDPIFQEHLAFRHLSEREVAADYRQRLAQAQRILGELRFQTGQSGSPVEVTSTRENSAATN